MTDDLTKILFVDANKNILAKLQQLVTDETWDCHFVSTASEALKFIAAEKVSLLVTEVGLPEADGIQLLSEITSNHPEIVRILLTSSAKDEKTLNALTAGYAQQIIPKPWIDQELKEIIRSALRQSHQQKKYCLKFQTLINSIPLLPALPESYSQVQGCIMDDDVDIEKMADIIGQDVSMSSIMLHWANSALFGQRFRVDTIKKAIVILGTDIVVNLILSEAITRSMTRPATQLNGFDLTKFKHHSMATAILARLLLKSLYSSDSELQDRAFIAGLLHDMGKLIAANYFSKQFATANRLAKQLNYPLHEAELKISGTTHAELGSFLAEWWALPHFIVTTVASHHNPKSSPVEPEIVNAVYLANLLSYNFGYGCNGEKIDREIDQDLKDKFFLTDEGLEILHVETDSIMKVLCSQN